MRCQHSKNGYMLPYHHVNRDVSCAVFTPRITPKNTLAAALVVLTNTETKQHGNTPGPFKCNQCNKTFARKDTLTNDFPIHSKVKQFR